MLINRAAFTRSSRTIICAIAPIVAGCSGNPNEDEFLKTAPPGLKSPFPNESYAERRERTRTRTTRELKEAAKTKSESGIAPVAEKTP